MEKILNLTGLLAILLVVAALLIRLIPVDGNPGIFYTLSVLITAVVFTPLFFVNHKKMYDAYKIPCYTASAIVGILLMLGSMLAGGSQVFGESNFYSGAFIVLCYAVVILLFRPAARRSQIVITLSVLMIADMYVRNFLT
jgi:hypothetical protein